MDFPWFFYGIVWRISPCNKKTQQREIFPKLRVFSLSCDYKIDDIKNNDLTSFFADQYIGYEENIIVFELKCSNFNGVFIF